MAEEFAEPVDPAVDPQTGAGEPLAVPTADVRDQAEIPTNTDGYGAENDLAVSTADVRRFADPGDEDAQQAAFQTFAAPGDEDAQDAAFGVFTSQNRVQVGVRQANNQPNNRALAQFPVNTDWRVVLRLAPGADYLYAAPDAGLLQPLKTTNGVTSHIQTIVAIFIRTATPILCNSTPHSRHRAPRMRPMCWLSYTFSDQ
jgi:hypothetical protein